MSAESLRQLEATASLCAELGHHVEEADPGVDGDAIVPAFLTLSAANTVVNLDGHPTKGRGPHPDEVEKVTWAMYERGKRVSGPDYVRAVNTAHRLGRQMAAFHADYDVLLTPGLADAAAKARVDRHDAGGRRRVLAPGVRVFAVHGVVQPDRAARADAAAGDERSGLPMATQLVARFGDEATLFRLAAQLEAARPWFERKPALVESTSIA